MSFFILGRDNGRHVVRLASGEIRHLTDEALAELQGAQFVPSVQPAVAGDEDPTAGLAFPMVKKAVAAMVAEAFPTVADLRAASDDDLLAMEGVDARVLKVIRKATTIEEN